MRRLFDIMVAFAAGLFLLPFMLLIALAVAVTMGRPVLFHQRRAGLGGTPFRLVKFRSMAEKRDAEGNLLPDAERITAFGRFLRRSRFDELPELLNILRGEMSLIGPRPILPETVEAMGAAGIMRGRMRPGLTGWAQVNGNALLENRDKLALDLWYIGNASLRLDLLIAIRTIGVILFGERINGAELRRAYAGDHRRRG